MDEFFITKPQADVIAFSLFDLPDHLAEQFTKEGSSGELLQEFAGRACYQSFHNPGNKSTCEYLGHIHEMRHGSVLEHDSLTFYIQGVSRSLTHELVRHRAGTAFSQLSMRYVDESETAFVIPPEYLKPGNQELLVEWKSGCLAARNRYTRHVEQLLEGIRQDFPNLTPTEVRKKAREAARSLLPHATETRIVLTANMRAWRHMLENRAVMAADAEICRLFAEHLFPKLQELRPSTFADFGYEVAPDGRRVLYNAHRKV